MSDCYIVIHQYAKDYFGWTLYAGRRNGGVGEARRNIPAAEGDGCPSMEAAKAEASLVAEYREWRICE